MSVVEPLVVVTCVAVLRDLPDTVQQLNRTMQDIAGRIIAYVEENARPTKSDSRRTRG